MNKIYYFTLGALLLMALNAQGDIKYPGLSGFVVAERSSDKFASFTFFDLNFSKEVKGYRSFDPIIECKDLAKISLETEEQSGRPVSGLRIYFRRDVLSRLAKLDAEAEIVLLFDDLAYGKVTSKHLKTLVETDGALFLALPITSSKEYSRISNRLQALIPNIIK